MVTYLPQRSKTSRLPASTWPGTAARSSTRRQTLNDNYNSDRYELSVQELYFENSVCVCVI